MWLLATAPSTPRATSALLCLIVTSTTALSSWRFSKILGYQTSLPQSPFKYSYFSPPLHLKNPLQEQQLEILIPTCVFTFFVRLERWSKEALFRLKPRDYSYINSDFSSVFSPFNNKKSPQWCGDFSLVI